MSAHPVALPAVLSHPRPTTRGGQTTMSDITTIATGLRFPEGPVAMPDGSVVLVEIERQTVTRVKPDGTTEIIAHTGGIVLNQI